MKYLGAISDAKDLVNKGYVDKAVPPHTKVYPYTQTFTASTSTTAWTYKIPWSGDELPSIDDLLNFNAYHYTTTAVSSMLEQACQMDKFYVYVSSSGYIFYIIVFYNSTSSGNSTIVCQNSFTDTDGTISGTM